MPNHYYELPEIVQKLRTGVDYELQQLRRQNVRMQQLSPEEASNRGITRYEPKPLGDSNA